MNILRDDHRVIGSDIKTNDDILLPGVTYDYCDVTDPKMIEAIVSKHKPTTIIHFSAILSGAGEKDPDLAQQVNVNGFLNILNCARKHNLKLFSPSTIAAFGSSTPRNKTPDITTMRPTSIYGVTKVFMELMGEYYHQKFAVDFRSLRLPGIISPKPIHGMGTTGMQFHIILSRT
jgi:threonine 3-dehydrogenase